MNYKQKINALVALHWVWIIVGILGLPAVIIFPVTKWVVLGFVIITILSWILFNGCLFVIWENRVHQQNSPIDSYLESFITHYLSKYFSINLSTTYAHFIIYIWMAALLVGSIVRIRQS